MMETRVHLISNIAPNLEIRHSECFALKAFGAISHR